MYAKKRRILPIILGIVILFAAIAGGWSWYDNNVDRSGWVEKDGNTYYYLEDGTAASGWLEVDGNRYHFGSDGQLEKGFREISIFKDGVML